MDLLLERVTVNKDNRHQRLLTLLKNLNVERKKQAKQIDILCNDIISAQRDFIKRLKTIDFRANFYEQIIGATDLNCLLAAATTIIKEETYAVNVTFFLRQPDSFEIYTFDENPDNPAEKQHIENCFSQELMNNICTLNKICKIEDMFAMGLQGNWKSSNTISAIAIPLDSGGSVLGFMLIHRSSEKKLTSEEIRKISSVSKGLSQAIYSCRALMHSSD